MPGGLVFLILSVSVLLLWKNYPRPKKSKVNVAAVEEILAIEIPFYQKLKSQEAKKQFLFRVVHFLDTTRFTDVGKAAHTFTDRVLVAASGIIPLHHFPEWSYINLDEVLFFENNFGYDFEVGEDKQILGMVGHHEMNRAMALSLPAVRSGFERKDGDHTVIHEFVHLIDKFDGSIDGIPQVFIPQHLVEPWLRFIRNYILAIRMEGSNINNYAATNESEFFAVVSEYFFDKPQLLERDHPELFQILRKIFQPTSTP
jgi:Mlc titration factor MtfA (ptsG expression regulator)